MAVTHEGGRPVIMFDLKRMKVDQINWQRIALTIRSNSSVKDAYVERGKRPGVMPGLLRVYPNLDRVPQNKVKLALEALDKVVDGIIAHRIANPDRLHAGPQLIPLSS